MYRLSLLNRRDLIYNHSQPNPGVHSHQKPRVIPQREGSGGPDGKRKHCLSWQGLSSKFLSLLCWLFSTFWMSNSQKALRGDGDSSLPQGRLPADYLLLLSGFLCTPGSWILKQLHPASYTMGHQGLDFLELGETNF